MNRLFSSITVGLQFVLWTVMLGFIALVALPRLTPYDVLIVRGGSMEPVIHLGAVIVIDRHADAPGIGSIVSFRESTGNVITHRVIGMDDGRYITQGDANRTRDLDERGADSVVGTVRFSVPLLGYLLYVLQQPIAFLMLLLSTGGYLIFGEVRAIIREIRRMRDRRLTHES